MENENNINSQEFADKLNLSELNKKPLLHPKLEKYFSELADAKDIKEKIKELNKKHDLKLDLSDEELEETEDKIKNIKEQKSMVDFSFNKDKNTILIKNFKVGEETKILELKVDTSVISFLNEKEQNTDINEINESIKQITNFKSHYKKGDSLEKYNEAVYNLSYKSHKFSFQSGEDTKNVDKMFSSNIYNEAKLKRKILEWLKSEISDMKKAAIDFKEFRKTLIKEFPFIIKDFKEIFKDIAEKSSNIPDKLKQIIFTPDKVDFKINDIDDLELMLSINENFKPRNEQEKQLFEDYKNRHETLTKEDFEEALNHFNTNYKNKDSFNDILSINDKGEIFGKTKASLVNKIGNLNELTYKQVDYLKNYLDISETMANMTSENKEGFLKKQHILMVDFFKSFQDEKGKHLHDINLFTSSEKGYYSAIDNDTLVDKDFEIEDLLLENKQIEKIPKNISDIVKNKGEFQTIIHDKKTNKLVLVFIIADPNNKNKFKIIREKTKFKMNDNDIENEKIKELNSLNEILLRKGLNKEEYNKLAELIYTFSNSFEETDNKEDMEIKQNALLEILGDFGILKDKKHIFKELNKKTEELNKEEEKLKILKNNQEEIEKDLKEKKAKIKTLSKENKLTVDNINGIQTLINSISSEKDRNNIIIKIEKDKIAQAEKEIFELEKINFTIEKEVNNLDTKIEKLRKELEELEKSETPDVIDITKKKAELLKATSEKSALDKTFYENNEKVASFRNDIKISETIVESKENNNKTIQENIDNKSKEKEAEEKINEKQNIVLNELEEKIKLYKKEFKKTEENIYNSEKKITDLRKEVKKLTEDSKLISPKKLFADNAKKVYYSIKNKSEKYIHEQFKPISEGVKKTGRVLSSGANWR